jgi:beta-lactamase class C
MASVSKAITSTALAVLVHDGRVNLDVSYAPPARPHPLLTLRHILSHTTGWAFTGTQQIESGQGRFKMLKAMFAQKPSCQPGQCYRYSNAAYSLVEEALNQKGLTLEGAINRLQQVLHTEELSLMPLPEGVAVAYPHRGMDSKSNHLACPLPPYYPKAAPAAAGVFASLSAMVEIFRLQFGYYPDRLPTQVTAQFESPQIMSNDVRSWEGVWPCSLDRIDSRYALGWRVLRHKNASDRPLIFHSGFLSGALSFIGFIPHLGVGLVIMVNDHDDYPLSQGLALWHALLKVGAV